MTDSCEFKMPAASTHLNAHVLDTIDRIKEISNEREFKISSVLDLGASYGLFSLRLAKYGCRVVAVEACVETMALLVDNIQRNNLGEQVIPLCVAVMDQYYIVAMRGGASMPANSIFCKLPVIGFSATVPLRAVLKELGPFDCIKCDIEGSEFAAFNSLEVGDLDGVKIIAIEIHNPDPCYIEEAVFRCDLHKVLKKHGFDFVEMTKEGQSIFAVPAMEAVCC